MPLRCLAITLALALLGTAAVGAPSYVLTQSVPLGAPDWWDYVLFDAGSGRVFVAHADRLTVVDGKSGKLVGTVEGLPGGAHGTAISAKAGVGVTDDGVAGLAVVFDAKTLKAVRSLKAAPDADAIAQDKATGRLFVVSGDPGMITVIDPAALSVVRVINVGEKLEFATGDGAGSIYVAGVKTGDLIRIDARTSTVTARWPTSDCQRPHGVAVDARARRVFMSCVNAVMMVMDADRGRVVAKLPIGRGSDAVAFDPKRRRVFSSNGQDGTVSVYQQTAPDAYTALAPVTTAVSGRTMAVDPASGRLFVAAAQTNPSATPGGFARPRPGSLALMMFDPVN